MKRLALWRVVNLSIAVSKCLFSSFRRKPESRAGIQQRRICCPTCLDSGESRNDGEYDDTP